MEQRDQTAKQDIGKPDPTLVPTGITWAIAHVRMFALTKYSDPENWKKVEPTRLKAAAYRHFLRYIENEKAVDEESGLPHLWHCCCNLAFLCEMERTHKEKRSSLLDGILD